MNELERLIAAVERPEPGHQLDHRIRALFVPPHVRSSKPRWTNALVACAAALCIGVLGFFLGRQSIGSSADPLPAIASTSQRHSRANGTPLATNVQKIPLSENQLASLFIRHSHREGLLGNGPVTILTSTSP
jgi:hypothetical protein